MFELSSIKFRAQRSMKICDVTWCADPRPGDGAGRGEPAAQGDAGRAAQEGPARQGDADGGGRGAQELRHGPGQRRPPQRKTQHLQTPAVRGREFS